MREILFRAKREDNGEWVEGLLGYDIHGNAAEIVVCKGFCNCKTYEVKPDTFCQYTGLRDKNGKKIFEGDIIKHFNNTQEPEEYYIGKIFFDERRACFCNKELQGETWMISKECIYEVIGNIFDNPELFGGRV